MEIKNRQKRLHEIIFEADTREGKLFDVVLIIAILLSVFAVMLDSIRQVSQSHAELLYMLEWIFTILFSIEYILRLISIGRPLHYAKSFFGVIDLLAILPTYFSLIFAGSHYFLVIRILRVLRIFRVFKLVPYLREAKILMQALRASLRKISIFLFVVILLVIIFGSLMYVIEGEENGFTSIPQSIYWAIVTLTTVGYGDISPKTEVGQALAAIIMILGYGIIAVPTGIVTVQMAQTTRENVSSQACQQCAREGHDTDAVFCKFCGSRL